MIRPYGWVAASSEAWGWLAGLAHTSQNTVDAEIDPIEG